MSFIFRHSAAKVKESGIPSVFLYFIRIAGQYCVCVLLTVCVDHTVLLCLLHFVATLRTEVYQSVPPAALSLQSARGGARLSWLIGSVENPLSSAATTNRPVQLPHCRPSSLSLCSVTIITPAAAVWPQIFTKTTATLQQLWYYHCGQTEFLQLHHRPAANNICCHIQSAVCK